MTAALSDELPFYDNPNECKPCRWCNKPIVRRELGDSGFHKFHKREVCSKVCKEKVRSGIYPGQQWGNLTVLSEKEPHVQPSGNRVSVWDCECSCKTRVAVRSANLKKGRVRSCGCNGRITPNQEFGMLKTIGKGEPCLRSNGRNRTTWDCVCYCGNQVNVGASDLLNGFTKSCGCKTTTRLEDTVEQSLNRLNVPYKKEHKPKSLTHHGFQYCLDFYLPDHKVNIEADGNTWHRDGNEYKSAEDQRAYDRYRNWWIQETLNCYVLRLSEDFLDTIHWRFLDNRLRLFLRSTLEPSPKDRPWKRVTYDFE